MKWRELSEDVQEKSLEAAARRFDNRVVFDDEDTPPLSNIVTFVDIARFARGDALDKSTTQINFAMRTNARLRMLFDSMMADSAATEIPMAAAASSGHITLRRDLETGVEVQLVASQAEPNTIFVRVTAPDSMRPLQRLVVRSGDEMEVLLLQDEAEDDIVEVLVDRASLAFRLIQEPESQLWIS